MVHLFMLLVQFSDKVFGVVHSPFEWLDHRCHLQLSVPSCSSSAYCPAECLRRDVVWWWFSSWWCFRFCLGQCEADDWKFLLLFISSTRVRGVYAC